MRKFRFILSFLLLYILFFSSICLAFDDNLYVWSSHLDSISTSSTMETSSNIDLKLESGAAILIEQSSR